MTGSTDAATDVVESATFRRTFNAIQSLWVMRFNVKCVCSDQPKHSLQEQLQDLVRAEGRIAADGLEDWL